MFVYNGYKFNDVCKRKYQEICFKYLGYGMKLVNLRLKNNFVLIFMKYKLYNNVKICLQKYIKCILMCFFK